VERNVVLEHEAGVRSVIAAKEQRVALKSRVAIDADVGSAVEKLKVAAATPLAADIDEEIVPNGNAC
jgi:hypothetical protein